MLESFVYAGHSPTLFWTLTPKLIVICLDQAEKRIVNDSRAARANAYLTARLSRTSEFPSFEKFMDGKEKSQSFEDQERAMKLWAAEMQAAAGRPQ